MLQLRLFGVLAGFVGLSLVGCSTLPMSDATHLKSISAGGVHTCGISKDNRAYCWGNATMGELGVGFVETTVANQNAEEAADVNFSKPQMVPDFSFTSISTGAIHTCAVSTGQNAYCWGEGYDGQLGMGTTHTTFSPVLVTGGHKFLSVAAGTTHSCGITTKNDAYCWGDNGYGELGDGDPDYTNKLKPVLVTGGLKFNQISTGDAHTCAITTTNDAYCWGTGMDGALGNSSNNRDEDHNTPVKVLGDLKFKQVAAGIYHTCALTTVGEAYCWGYNETGQLGSSDHTDHDVPEKVNSTLTFVDITVGELHSCALSNTGQAYCWGINDFGQLGVESQNNTTTVVCAGSCAVSEEFTTDNSESPEDTEAAVGTPLPHHHIEPKLVSADIYFTDISAGDNHTCGVTKVNTTYCWGDNFHGQLGDDSYTKSYLPRSLVW